MTDDQDEDEDIEWPRPGSSIHTVTNNRFAADLTKLRYGALGYELGYRRAAELLYAHMVATHASLDSLVFPLAYLWRHGIELQIKRLVVTAARLRPEELDTKAFNKRLHHHHLKPLWDLAREQLMAIGEYDESCPPVGVEDLEHALDELDKLDPEATGFRFHENRQGGPTLSNPPATLDLANFHRVLRDVHGFVEAANTQVAQRLETDASPE